MAKKSKTSKMFIPVRGSYLPNSWLGWLTYLPFTAYLLFSAYFGWQGADTTTSAVLFIVPNWIAAAAAMTWLARHTS